MDVLLPATVLYLVDIYTCTHTVKTCYIRYQWWKVAPPKPQADFRIAHLNALRKPGRQVSRYLARRGLGGRSPPHGRYSAVPQTNYRLGKGPPLTPIPSSPLVPKRLYAAAERRLETGQLDNRLRLSLPEPAGVKQEQHGVRCLSAAFAMTPKAHHRLPCSTNPQHISEGTAIPCARGIRLDHTVLGNKAYFRAHPLIPPSS